MKDFTYKGYRYQSIFHCASEKWKYIKWEVGYRNFWKRISWDEYRNAKILKQKEE